MIRINGLTCSLHQQGQVFRAEHAHRFWRLSFFNVCVLRMEVVLALRRKSLYFIWDIVQTHKFVSMVISSHVA